MKVYAIRAGTNAIKFGVSENPEIRLRGLQTGNYLPLFLMVERHTEGDGLFEESCIHAALEDVRLEGEWFEYCEASLEMVGLIRSGDLQHVAANVICQICEDKRYHDHLDADREKAKLRKRKEREGKK